MRTAQTAFFDLDKTVFGINSGFKWLLSEWRKGHIKHRQALKGVIGLLRYTAGADDLGGLIEGAIRDYEGLPEAVLASRTRIFFREQVEWTIRAEARSQIDLHRRLGHKCVILTTSSQYMCESVREVLPFDDHLCTVLEAQEGNLTGRTVQGVCFGAGKLAAMTHLLARKGERLEDSFFYTDSYSDRPGLAAVGYPRVVCPDRKLRQFALRAGWPILEWGPE